jgi:arylsulfatase A-like enzyme
MAQRVIERWKAKWWAALLLLGLVAAAVPTGAPTPAARAQGAKPPNVLIVMTDDQRDDRASMKVMGSTRGIFKERGKYFKHAIATTPLCCPSRASIFSGQYAHNHDVTNNGDAEDFNPDDSLQAVLDGAGYQTAYSGKYLNLEPIDPAHFDLFAIMRGGKLYRDFDMNINGDIRTIHGYSTDFIGEKARDFLTRFENQDEAPWLLIVAPNAPHLPATPERKYRGTHVPRWESNPATEEDTPRKLRDKPEYVRKNQTGEDKAKRFRRDRLLSLKSVDDMVKKIFDKLKGKEETGKTLAFFISDNGFMLHEHGVTSKRYPYDMSVEIPMYMRWPGRVSRGTTNKKIVGNIDIAPTVYDAANTPPGYPVDGRSLFQSGQRDHILIESWPERGIPRWNGLWTPGTQYLEYGTGEQEYYRAKDRWELVNRLGNRETSDDPNNEQRLSTLVDVYSSCAGPSCP